jgi:hypothetical protein
MVRDRPSNGPGGEPAVPERHVRERRVPHGQRRRRRHPDHTWSTRFLAPTKRSIRASERGPIRLAIGQRLDTMPFKFLIFGPRRQRRRNGAVPVLVEPFCGIDVSGGPERRYGRPRRLERSGGKDGFGGNTSAQTDNLDSGRRIGGSVHRRREFIASAVPDAPSALHPMGISARNLSQPARPLAPFATYFESCKIVRQ